MRFGRVLGHGRLIIRDDEPMISLAVVLDAGSTVTVVRDETVPWLTFGPVGDVAWQIDQLTQETLGTTLADSGWETISEDDSQRGETDDGLSHSSAYVVRNVTSTLVREGDDT
jgi:hypothetical protein